jgi:hypothetical protein
MAQIKDNIIEIGQKLLRIGKRVLLTSSIAFYL